MFVADDTQADVVFKVSEGPQVVVDHIIIVGNRRISTRTIERELLLREGEPLGSPRSSRAASGCLPSASSGGRRSSRSATAAKRAVTCSLKWRSRRPPSSGTAAVSRAAHVLRTGENGLAEEHFEVAPRGFFQIGRRNLWGKNRRVDLFTRLAVTPRDPPAVEATPDPFQNESARFYEYRVLGQFREPKAFDTQADVVVTALQEQARQVELQLRAERGAS